MLKSLEYWRDQIAKIGLPEMPIERVLLADASARWAWGEPRAVAQKLLRFAYYEKIPDLAQAGFPIEVVASLGRGEFPENLSVAFKTPAAYGGRLDLANMFLIARYPFREMLDKFYDMQVLEYNHELYGDAPGALALPPEMFVAAPKGIVFLPALRGFTSAGGNATTDRMTEIGSTLGLAAQADAEAAAIAAAVAAKASAKDNI